jgi:hypothetical protein
MNSNTVIATPFVVVLGLVFGLILIAGSGTSGYEAVCSQAGPNPAGQPPLTRYYVNAARQFQLGADGYAYLAAVNKVETGFGTNIAESSAGAIGWMQFEPATYTEYSRVPGATPDTPADPDDPQDAIYAAAADLHANGAPKTWSTAIYAYNHADWYVTEVETDAKRYIGINGLSNLANDISAAWGASTQPEPQWTNPQQPTTENVSYTIAPTCPQQQLDVAPVPGELAVIMPNGLARPPQGTSNQPVPVPVQAMVDAGDRITSFDYQWGGGHANPAQSDNQTTPEPEGGTEPGQDGTPGYDCSGSTDYVLWGGGYGQSILDDADPASGELMALGEPGADPKGWVTWYANAGHVFIELAGIVLDTVHGPTSVQPNGAPSTGPRWAGATEVAFEQSTDGTFTPRHIGAKL